MKRKLQGVMLLLFFILYCVKIVYANGNVPFANITYKIHKNKLTSVYINISIPEDKKDKSIILYIPFKSNNIYEKNDDAFITSKSLDDYSVLNIVPSNGMKSLEIICNNDNNEISNTVKINENSESNDLIIPQIKEENVEKLYNDQFIIINKFSNVYAKIGDKYIVEQSQKNNRTICYDPTVVETKVTDSSYKVTYWNPGSEYENNRIVTDIYEIINNVSRMILIGGILAIPTFVGDEERKKMIIKLWLIVFAIIILISWTMAKFCAVGYKEVITSSACYVLLVLIYLSFKYYKSKRGTFMDNVKNFKNKRFVKQYEKMVKNKKEVAKLQEFKEILDKIDNNLVKEGNNENIC